MKRLVVLTGSGISAESGLKTFRDSGGLWEGFKVEDVASPLGFRKDPARVLDFYNQRRKQAKEAQPNPAHFALAQLEAHYHVHIITQNVDDLHERAGSTQVLHIHGQLNLARSVADPNYVVEVEEDILLGDLSPEGDQLRPHIVWFGESVPDMEEAAILSATADIFLIIGTSLKVYPANGLVDIVPKHAPIYLIDPVIPDYGYGLSGQVKFIEEKASIGVPALVDHLIGESLRSKENLSE